MQITAQSLLNHKIIDGIIKEPLGGAHRNPEEAAISIKQSLIENLKLFSEKSSVEIIDDRKNKFLSIGSQLPEEISTFDHKNLIHFSKDKFSKNKKTFIFLGVAITTLFIISFLY